MLFPRNCPSEHNFNFLYKFLIKNGSFSYYIIMHIYFLLSFRNYVNIQNLRMCVIYWYFFDKCKIYSFFRMGSTNLLNSEEKIRDKTILQKIGEKKWHICSQICIGINKAIILYERKLEKAENVNVFDDSMQKNFILEVYCTGSNIIPIFFFYYLKSKQRFSFIVVIACVYVCVRSSWGFCVNWLQLEWD